MRKSNCVIIIFFCLTLTYFLQPAFASESFGIVTHIYDGDTIAVKLDKTIEKVRLLGVDTPERKDKFGVAQCFSTEATQFTKKFLLNKKVRLEKDSMSKNRDVYGRLLRYVYVKKSSMNVELLKNGFAYAYTRSPIRKLDTFIKHEKSAREHKRGLWSKATCNGRRH